VTANDGLPETDASRRMTDAINRLAASIARHWLAIFNVVVFVFFALPFLAPALNHAGATGAANVIYRLYGPACHQLPDRSVFLYGDEHFHTVEELEASGAIPPGLNALQRQALRWQGNVETGWKVALCQRDLAIYGAIFAGGLVFGLLRPTLRKRLRPDGKWPKMPVWMFALFLLPIAIDGFSQLFGLRTSTPALRFLTGALMGAATVWFAYPYVEEAMQDVIKNTPPPAGAEPNT
jgi:uncharacterized membrane protein